MKSFEQFRGLRQSSSPFNLRNLLKLLNNQLFQVSSVSFFERVNKGELNMVNINYQRLTDLAIL